MLQKGGLNENGGRKRNIRVVLNRLSKYSRSFHIYNTTTTPDVWIRRVFVWRLVGSMEVEAMACMGESLGAVEMFWEHSGIALGGELKAWN